MGLSASPVGRRSRCVVNEAPQLGHRGRPERIREGGHPAHSRVIALECATTQGHHGALGHHTKRPPGSPAGRGIQLGIPPENRQLFVWRSHQDLVRNAPRNNWQSTRQVHLATFGRKPTCSTKQSSMTPGGTGTLQTRRISAAETTDRRSLHRWWCHPTHPAEPATG